MAKKRLRGIKMVGVPLPIEVARMLAREADKEGRALGKQAVIIIEKHYSAVPA